MTKSRVLFFAVHTPTEKLGKITEIVKDFFEKKQSFLILTKEEKTLHYLDELLWKHPEESFLPHKVADLPCQELIVLTEKRENLNRAGSIFNFTGAALLTPPEGVTKIYELEDFTSPEKKILSEKRFKAYRDAGFAITSL